MNDVVPLLKHTPSAQRPEVLEAITVQREPLVAALVESALDPRGGLRHHLLVGPRGIGKTHVLSLVASRVRSADPEAKTVVVGWLDEDPWPVRTYGKFLAAIAARVAEATGEPELGRAASQLRAAADDDGLRGEELVRRAIGERRLVLLVENLDEIFRRIGTEGQLRFRAFAEDWARMLVIATTPQLFAGVRRHDSPFYGFFAVDHLDELSLESAADLLKRIAQLRGDARLLRFLGTDAAMGRLRAIEALAGGHPRVWLLLAGCISVAAIEELVPLFLEALDDLTPYYQDRLRELGDQQQEIVVLLSEAGGALSNRALSERSGIPERQVATILKQLADRGYVRRARLPEDLSVGDKRMSHWELREPLMRLCLDVKQARGEPLRIVVEFLRAWYGPRLLDELDRLPPTAELATVYASEAFRTLETPLTSDDLLRGSPKEILSRAERGLALQPESRPLLVAQATGLLMQERHAEARQILERLVTDEPPGLARIALRLQFARARRGLGESVDAGPLVADAEQLGAQHPGLREAIETLGLVYSFAGREEDALDAYARASTLAPDNPGLASASGLVLSRLGRDEEALAAFTRATELAPEEPDYHDNRGVALSRLERDEEALAAFERATELAPDGGFPHFHRGIMLQWLGRDDEALEALSRAVELEPRHSVWRRHQAIASMRLGRAEEALAAILAAIELNPQDDEHHGTHGWILERLGRAEEARAAYLRAVELNPRNPGHLNDLANLLRQRGAYAEAEELARRAVALDDKGPIYRFTLAEAVLSAGDPERGLSLLTAALELWSRRRATAPGETDLLCRIVWHGYRQDARRHVLVAGIADAFRQAGAVEELGRGLVATIPLLLDEQVPQADVDAWIEDWARAPFGDAEVPLQMLEAARAWKRDRDQAHLLALPPEQREILVGMLPR